jgi:DNA-binding LacI/PurR family transcriptional regulator
MNVTAHIRTTVISDILAGKYLPGARIPTEREMAERLGASRVSVRAAYRLLGQDGVIRREQGSGTTVSSLFQGHGGKPAHIAVLTTLRDPFAREFIEALQEACNEADILTVLAVTEENTRAQAAMAIRMVHKGIRNMIVWGFDKSIDIPLFERIRICGTNLVFFDRVRPGPCADFVGLDNRHAIQALFAEAVKAGASEFIYANASGLDVDSNRERRDAFVDECQRRRVAHRTFSLPWDGGGGRAAGICRRFFSSPPGNAASALFCVNDVVALAIRPFVPKRTKVYSIDGSATATALGIRSYPQPVKAMAAAAVRSILRQSQRGPTWKATETRLA